MKEHKIFIVNKKNVCIFFDKDEITVRSCFKKFKIKVKEEFFDIAKEILAKTNTPIYIDDLIMDIAKKYELNNVKQMLKVLLENNIIMVILPEQIKYLNMKLFNIFMQVKENPVESFSKFMNSSFHIIGEDRELISYISNELIINEVKPSDENKVLISINSIPDEIDQYNDVYIVLSEEKINSLSISKYTIINNEYYIDKIKQCSNTKIYDEAFLKIFTMNAIYYIINNFDIKNKSKEIEKLIVNDDLEVLSEKLIAGDFSSTTNIFSNKVDLLKTREELEVILLQEFEMFIKKYKTVIEGCSGYGIEELNQFPVSAYSIKLKDDDTVYVNFSDEYIKAGNGTVRYLFKEILGKNIKEDGFWIVDFKEEIRKEMMIHLLSEEIQDYEYYSINDVLKNKKYRYLIDYIKENKLANEINVVAKKIKGFAIYQIVVEADHKKFITPFSSDLNELYDLAIYNFFGLMININKNIKINVPLKIIEEDIKSNNSIVTEINSEELLKGSNDNYIEMINYINDLNISLNEVAWYYESYLDNSGFGFRKFMINGKEK